MNFPFLQMEAPVHSSYQSRQPVLLRRIRNDIDSISIHVIIVVLTSILTSVSFQTVALVYSFQQSGQPGPLTRLLSCYKEDLKGYRGMDLAPTFVVPSWSLHPRTGDW